MARWTNTLRVPLENRDIFHLSGLVDPRRRSVFHNRNIGGVPAPSDLCQPHPVGDSEQRPTCDNPSNIKSHVRVVSSYPLGVLPDQVRWVDWDRFFLLPIVASEPAEVNSFIIIFTLSRRASFVKVPYITEASS